MLNLNHKNLDVYKVAKQLVKEIYRVTKSFPKEEQFELVKQLRRAGVSVCSNIAEGCARKTRPDRKRLYEIARSSVVEIDTQLEISFEVEYLKAGNIPDLENCMERVFQMLSKMIVDLGN